MSKLTATQVRGIRAPGKYGDGRNLWLIVTPTGRKRWEFRYTFQGKRRYMTLGPLDFLSLAEARDRALETRRQLWAGTDPMEARKAKKPRRLTTFRDVATEAIASFQKGWSKGASANRWSSPLRHYAYPSLGDMDVRAITTEDVYAVIDPLWTEKPETARRLRARIERILDFATAMKLRTGDNPARLKGNLEFLLPSVPKIEKHFDALPFDDVAGFMADLRTREAVAARALEFTILTAARTGEVIGAKWSEMDLDAGVWTVPSERMKTRRSTNRDHRVPLTKAAIALLKSLPRDPKSDFVFISPAVSGKSISNMAMTNVLKRMKRKEGTTVHGFRSTFRDWAAERTGYSNEVIEMALAHVIGNAVEAAYRRGDLFEKRRHLMEDWEAFCAGEVQSSAKIVNIRA